MTKSKKVPRAEIMPDGDEGTMDFDSAPQEVIHITCGDDSWAPDDAELEMLAKLFTNATGLNCVATRRGVDVNVLSIETHRNRS